MIKLKFLKELMLTRQVNQKKVIFICHNRYFLDKGFMFQPNTCNECHYLLMMSMNLSEITVLNMRIIAVLVQNNHLIEKT